MQEKKIDELGDISTSDNTRDSSSEYNLNAVEVEDRVSATLYSNISSILEPVTKRNPFLVYNLSKRMAQVERRL